MQMSEQTGGGYMGSPGDNFLGAASADNLDNRSAAINTYSPFPEDRWRRAGADDEQVEQLRALHASKSPEEQAVEGKRIASISDGDLANELAIHASTGGDPKSSPYAGTRKEVLEAVGNDPVKAQEALTFERSGFGQNRKTVVEDLEKIIAGGASQQPQSTNPQPGANDPEQTGEPANEANAQ